MMKTTKIIHIEDDELDSELVARALGTGGIECDLVRVQTRAELERELAGRGPDVVLSDFSLPGFSGEEALSLARQRHPDVPFVYVSGTIGEERAVEALRSGATDYVLKDRLQKLVPAVRRAIDEARSRRALEEKDGEIRAMTQQLWQAAKLATMGELAACIAHELNNPLATITLRLEALSAAVPEGDPKRKALDVISAEIDRMAALVANLLQFSRRGSQHVSTVDVRVELDRTLDLIVYGLEKRGIVVERQYGQDVPAIHADRQQLRQVFLNLFTNAMDAMPSGGKLTLAASASSRPKEVEVEVRDTGTGIAAEHRSRVTEPFFTTKPEGKGTGLGLSICRRIVAEHGGELTIESEPGRGTGVRITLCTRDGINGAHLGGEEL